MEPPNDASASAMSSSSMTGLGGAESPTAPARGPRRPPHRPARNVVMLKSGKRKGALNVAVAAGVALDLRTYAAEQNLSVSDAVERALRFFLDAEDAKHAGGGSVQVAAQPKGAANGGVR